MLNKEEVDKVLKEIKRDTGVDISPSIVNKVVRYDLDDKFVHKVYKSLLKKIDKEEGRIVSSPSIHKPLIDAILLTSLYRLYRSLEEDEDKGERMTRSQNNLKLVIETICNNASTGHLSESLDEIKKKEIAEHSPTECTDKILEKRKVNQRGSMKGKFLNLFQSLDGIKKKEIAEHSPTEYTDKISEESKVNRRGSMKGEFLNSLKHRAISLEHKDISLKHRAIINSTLKSTDIIRNR